MRTADHEALLDIYNHYIETSPATFDTHTFTLTQRASWYRQFGTGVHLCLVAQQGSSIVGYACSQEFKQKPAYRTSVETSIYIAPSVTACGVGSSLYTSLFTHLAQQTLHRAYAGITLPNEASVRLHEKFGFKEAALFTEVGYKFDQYWDVAWYEKPLS